LVRRFGPLRPSLIRATAADQREIDPTAMPMILKTQESVEAMPDALALQRR
jgi:hypothetical protein